MISSTLVTQTVWQLRCRDVSCQTASKLLITRWANDTATFADKHQRTVRHLHDSRRLRGEAAPVHHRGQVMDATGKERDPEVSEQRLSLTTVIDFVLQNESNKSDIAVRSRIGVIGVIWQLPQPDPDCRVFQTDQNLRALT